MAKIGIIGVGKVGLAYALAFEKAGNNVFASSYKSEYIDQLQNKNIRTVEPEIEQLLHQSKNIEFTVHNHVVIQKSNIIYVMVATPSTPDGDYDISAIEQVAEDFKTCPSELDGKILVIGSTVNPGTCEIIEQKLQGTGVKVAYSPTFIAQGSVMDNIANFSSVLVGAPDNWTYKLIQKAFSKISKPECEFVYLSPMAAEISKLAANCKSTLQIVFHNKIAELLIKNNLYNDVDTALQWLNNSKKGHSWNFGFGYGGPCLPRDNLSMAKFAEKSNNEYEIGTMVDKYNTQHVNFLVDFLISNNKNNLPFYLDYLTYKPGVNLTDPSQQYEVCKALLSKNKIVYVNDNEFLPESWKFGLKQRYKELVKFIKPESIDNEIYKICF